MLLYLSVNFDESFPMARVYFEAAECAQADPKANPKRID